MKITEELLKEMKVKDDNFSDGDYIRITKEHLLSSRCLI